MSQPVLFLSPSCPCPGSPEEPQGGFIGGHDCRQRCGICPSVTIEAEVESADCYFGGFRQYDSAGAPTPPLWYKRRDFVRNWQYDAYFVSQLKPCDNTYWDQVATLNDPTCGAGRQMDIVSSVGGCIVCTETMSNPGGPRALVGSYDEWGLVDGRPAAIGSDGGTLEPQPATTISGCEPGVVDDVYYTWAFPHVTHTDGETGALAPNLMVVGDRSSLYYRQAGDFPGTQYVTSYRSWALCPTEDLATSTLYQWAGDAEVTITDYQAYELSDPWTEEEIIAAAPKSTGGGSVAVGGWELRTDRSWQWWRSTWEIVATGLVEGVTYEVKPILRESAWVRDQTLNWVDVDIAWERFTATASDAANGRRIEGGALDPVRGMRTEVTGALIRIVEEGE